MYKMWRRERGNFYLHACNSPIPPTYMYPIISDRVFVCVIQKISPLPVLSLACSTNFFQELEKRFSEVNLFCRLHKRLEKE